MWAFIVGFFQSWFAITGVWWIDFIIYFVVEAFIAFPLAFFLTGKIFKAIGIYDSDAMV